MTVVSINFMCLRCKHLRQLRPVDGFGPATCDAFPLGMPKEFQKPYHSIDHRKPYPGDQGIRFEAKFPDDDPEKML